MTRHLPFVAILLLAATGLLAVARWVIPVASALAGGGRALP